MMQVRISFVVVILLLGSTLMNPSPSGGTLGAGGRTTITVDAGGGGDHTTIQAAVDAASSGDTIIVKTGTYAENVELDIRLALQGEGSAGTIIDVRNDDEIEAIHIPGSRHIVLSDIPNRLDDVRKTPAPRLILCRTGIRAANAVNYLSSVGVGGLSVIDGGIVAYARDGGETKGGGLEALEGGGGYCAALPPSD